jgi:transcriptional regulator with XRE-family HTH domain
MTIGNRIKVLRNKKGLSQAELCRLATLKQPTLHGYESGHRPAEGMSVDAALRLAQALGVTLDYLAGAYEQCTC